MAAAVLVLLAIFAGYKVVQLANIDTFSEHLQADEGIYLDVRTKGEFAEGHVPGAINVPLGTLRDDYVQLDPKRTYIVYCSHGLRSIKAVSILKENGFLHVLNAGPMSNLKTNLFVD